jgi:hypothetical protein
MKRHLKSFSAAVAVALISCGAAHANSLSSFTLLGEDTTAGQSVFSNSVAVSPGDTVAFQVLGTMSALTTTVGGQTINSLTFGPSSTADGVISFPFLLNDTQDANIPIVFGPLTLAPTGTGNGSSAGTSGSSTISFQDVVNTGSSYKGFGVTATNTPGYQLLASGTFVVGGTIHGTNTVMEGWKSGGAGGSIDINGGSSVGLNDTNHATYDTGAYTGLTLTAAPEPGSLGCLLMTSVGLLAARRRRARSV